jgi:hypothetical protein
MGDDVVASLFCKNESMLMIYSAVALESGALSSMLGERRQGGLHEEEEGGQEGGLR